MIRKFVTFLLGCFAWVFQRRIDYPANRKCYCGRIVPTGRWCDNPSHGFKEHVVDISPETFIAAIEGRCRLVGPVISKTETTPKTRKFS